ncbi:MAG: hypothetical protein ACPHXR_04670 [Flavicella sp.]
MKKKIVYWGGFLPLCVFSQLVCEPFEYVNDTFLSDTELWQPHSGTPGQLQITDGKLWLNDTDNEDVHIAFDESMSTLYYSFTLSVEANSVSSGSQYFAHLNTSAFKAKLFITYTDEGFIPGIATSASTPAVHWVEVLDYDEHYRFVVKYDGTTTLWINPSSETDTSISDLETSDAGATAFCFRQAPHPGSFNASVDDLFIATTFFEVLQTHSIERYPRLSISVRDGVVFSDVGLLLEVYNTLGQKIENKGLKGVCLARVSLGNGYTKTIQVIAP